MFNISWGRNLFSIYENEIEVLARFAFSWCRGPAASNQGQKTSVAGTATQDSGHDRAQRGQNPGITFAWAVKSANSTSLPCLILLQIMKMPAVQY